MTLIERLYKSHDAETLCADAARAIEKLQAENERLKTEYGNACKLVADMHAAAIGQAVGPIRGVVEDVTDVRLESDALAAKLATLTECAKRLVDHADFQLGGILSADSKAKDIPSRAVSQVKSRHLAALRDLVAIDAAKGGQHEDA